MRRYRWSRSNKSRKNKSSNLSVRLITCMLLILVGAALSVPFVYYSFISSQVFPLDSWWPLIIVACLTIGAPMLLSGIVSLMVSPNVRNATNNLTNLDIARIRYAIETDTREALRERQRNK